MFLQVLQELRQIGSAVVFQDINELRHVTKDVGRHAVLPVDVVDQVLYEVAQGKFFFVVLQPGDRNFFPVVGLPGDGEVWFSPVVFLGPVFLVDVEVAGPGPAEGVRLEVANSAGPPKFGVCDRVLPGSDINDLVIEANEGVQFRSFGVAPQGNDFGRRDAHEGQFAGVVEVGLNPGDPGLDRAFPQALDLPAEGLVKDFVQGFAIFSAFRVHGPGLRQKVVCLLVHQFFQDRPFDLRVRSVGDVDRLLLDGRPVPVIRFGFQYDLILFGLLELPDFLADDLGQGHSRFFRVGQDQVDPVHDRQFHFLHLTSKLR